MMTRDRICLPTTGLSRLIDDGDRVVEQKRLPNDVPDDRGFAAFAGKSNWPASCRANYNWYGLVDGLQDAGFSGLWPIPLHGEVPPITNKDQELGLPPRRKVEIRRGCSG